MVTRRKWRAAYKMLEVTIQVVHADMSPGADSIPQSSQAAR